MAYYSNLLPQDIIILPNRAIATNKFSFGSVTFPGNVKDAIIVKHPYHMICTPGVIASTRSLEEHIEFINRHKIEKAHIIAPNIEFITACPSLKYLLISPAGIDEDNFDYSPLYDMPQIKSLGCPTTYGLFIDKFRTTIDLGKIRGLESVHIYDKGQLNYKEIKTLKSLGFGSYDGEDLVGAFSSTIIDTLTLIECKIRTLEGIQLSPKMQCVYLYYNRRLKDISALSKCKKTLRALRIECCSKIEDFSVLGELENLELLQLTGSNELPNLDFLKNMKNLKTFIFNVNVKDGDLSPCLWLSYVHSSRIRRHYNLKNADLPHNKYYRGNDSIEEWRRTE